MPTSSVCCASTPLKARTSMRSCPSLTPTQVTQAVPAESVVTSGYSWSSPVEMRPGGDQRGTVLSEAAPAHHSPRQRLTLRASFHVRKAAPAGEGCARSGLIGCTPAT